MRLLLRWAFTRVIVLHLNASTTYRIEIGAFFFQEVEVLMVLSPTERLQKLKVLSDDQIASQGDDEYPDQVHCESLRNQSFS